MAGKHFINMAILSGYIANPDKLQLREDEDSIINPKLYFSFCTMFRFGYTGKPETKKQIKKAREKKEKKEVTGGARKMWVLVHASGKLARYIVKKARKERYWLLTGQLLEVKYPNLNNPKYSSLIVKASYAVPMALEKEGEGFFDDEFDSLPLF